MTELSEDERQRLQIATAALRAIVDNAGSVYTAPVLSPEFANGALCRIPFPGICYGPPVTA